MSSSSRGSRPLAHTTSSTSRGQFRPIRPSISLLTARPKYRWVTGVSSRKKGSNSSSYRKKYMTMLTLADILQVLGMLLDDLLNEVRVSGAQVRRGRLIELKLKPPPQRRHTDEALARSMSDRCWKICRTTWWGRLPQSSAGDRVKLDGPRFCLLALSSWEGNAGHFDLRPFLPRFILKQISTLSDQERSGITQRQSLRDQTQGCRTR
ncbi:hypothetical protein INR49_024330 [Caranx melampygus]|nr:hypothetical protein INR49_024330 [Caranx melampygus]